MFTYAVITSHVSSQSCVSEEDFYASIVVLPTYFRERSYPRYRPRNSKLEFSNVFPRIRVQFLVWKFFTPLFLCLISYMKTHVFNIQYFLLN